VSDLFRPAGTLERDGDPVAISPEDAGWELSALRIVTLAPGETRALRLEGFEAALLPFSGSCTVEVGSASFELEGRPDVFSRVSDFAYLGAGREVHLSSARGGEFALPSARADTGREPAYVPAHAVRVEVRGGGVATRQINDFMAADAFEAERLIAVEVLTPDGNWSSFPPHKHDERTETEVPLEEIYYFRIMGNDGFGFHRTYTLDGEIDETVTVGHGDVFLIPRGFHGPCVAAPGHPMYYLNVMAGPYERAWQVCMDPAHDWLADVLARTGPDPRCPMTSASGPAPGAS
jgi:5-deoxy-glucuronate isomerase